MLKTKGKGAAMKNGGSFFTENLKTVETENVGKAKVKSRFLRLFRF